ncbi:MAG: AAA family ATPase [Clostridia bacterium]|nr:AAA family ATPase [Clostridia bacterium]
MQKSKFFRFILACCQTEEDINKGKPVSINVFFGTVLKALAIGKEAFRGAVADSDLDEMGVELDAVKEKVSVHTSDFVQAHDNLFSYIASNSGGFLDNYLYAKIMTEFEINKPASYVITVTDVCQKILDDPTQAIKYALNMGEQPQTSSESTPLDDDFISTLLGGPKNKHTPGGAQTATPPTVEPKGKPTGMIADIVKRTDSIREILSKSVYGQDHAISAFASGYFQAELTAATQKHRDKPKATFLFAGPPGTGKTFLSEQVAQALKLPFRRFDMSEYSDKEANLEFAGSDKVYKNGAEGNVTGFVAKNPKCILLFDEVEKAHLNIIHLFLQILDAGRLRDNYTDEDVSFTDAIIIFTTNAGRQMYEDESINLLTASRKSILQALSTDVNPITGVALFPPAICSRFAFGNVIMFNHMSASHLMQIADGEMRKQAKAIITKSNVKIELDERLPYAVIFSEGGKADARTIKGKSISFVYQELYELLRLVNSENNNYSVEELKSIKFELLLPENERVLALFERQEKPDVLLFADEDVGKKCTSLIKSANVHVANDQEEALTILEKNDIAIIVCDLKCGQKGATANALSVEDTDSCGRDFFDYLTSRGKGPLYVLAHDEKEISREEWFSLSKAGATGVLIMKGGTVSLDKAVIRETTKVFQHKNLFELGRANKVVTFKTLQQISEDGKEAKIVLFDFRLKTAVDAQDSHGVLDAVSKPNVHFSDVIGAKDAKD